MLRARMQTARWYSEPVSRLLRVRVGRSRQSEHYHLQTASNCAPRCQARCTSYLQASPCYCETSYAVGAGLIRYCSRLTYSPDAPPRLPISSYTKLV